MGVLSVVSLTLMAAPAQGASIYDLVSGGSSLAGYSIVGLPGINNIHLSSGPLSVNGNIAVGDTGQFKADGGGTIKGTVYTGNSVTVSNSGDTITGGVVSDPTRVSSVVSAAISLATYAASRTPTQPLISSINNNATTITGTGGLNVIQVTGNIALSGANLTISGGSNDLFVFQVQGSGGIQISGGSQVVLNGISSNQLLFYVPGSANNIVQTSSSNNGTNGIFLTPNGGIQINGGVDSAEFIADTSFSAQSNPVINTPPTPGVPEPASWSLLGIGLLSFAVLAGRPVLRRRRSEA